MKVTFCEPILPLLWNHFIAGESENDMSAQSASDGGGKSLQTMSDMILPVNRSQRKQPNRSKMKCDVWKLCTSSDQRWQDELRFSISRFLEQFAFVNSHLLCYWPTIHNLISKISRLTFLKRASSDCRRLRNTLCLCLPVRRTPTRPSSPRGQAVPDRGPKSSAIDFCSQLLREWLPGDRQGLEAGLKLELCCLTNEL